VAKDDKKAFAELRQACDESLAEGGIDFHRSPGAIKLSLQQRKAMTVRIASVAGNRPLTPSAIFP